MDKHSISVLIPDGESNRALRVAYCLAQIPGTKIHFLSKEKSSLTRYTRYRSSYSNYSNPETEEKRLEIIWETAKKIKADVVLPVDISAIRLLAKNKGKTGPGIPVTPIPYYEEFETATDKWLLSKILAKNNIPHPQTVLYTSGDTSIKDLEALTFPVVTKPTDEMGGIGIHFFDTFSELNKFLVNENRYEKLIIQSFIKGYDMGCSVLCNNGEIFAYTIQKGIIPSRKKFGPPAGIEFVRQEQVYTAVSQLMKELNWSGVANIDLRYDEGELQPKILEINARFWDSLLGSLVAGVNFPYLACLLGLKIDFTKPEYQLKNYFNARATLTALSQNLTFTGKHNMSFSDTELQFTIKDPLSFLINYLRKATT